MAELDLTVSRNLTSPSQKAIVRPEDTKIELLEGSLRESDLNVTLPRTTNNSITLAKLLKNVEKSYERGRKLLDYVVANILRNMESNHISEEKMKNKPYLLTIMLVLFINNCKYRHYYREEDK